MDVGIRELKARLSEFVERAARGETIRVTRRGRPQAQLTGLPKTDNGDDAIDRGIDEGWITAPTSRQAPIKRRRRFEAGITLEDLMAEDRGE